MSEQHQQDNDIVGLGVRSTSPVRASRDRIWKVMVDKMNNTQDYLPVTDVHTVEKVPGRHLYREMVFKGEKLCHNIYLDEERCEIRAHTVGTNEITVNLYDPDTSTFEYYMANQQGERIPWHIPKSFILKAMQITKEKAEK